MGDDVMKCMVCSDPTTCACVIDVMSMSTAHHRVVFLNSVQKEAPESAAQLRLDFYDVVEIKRAGTCVEVVAWCNKFGIT